MTSIPNEYTDWLYFNGRWEDNVFLGVQCFQNPNDVWMIQEIISRTKPSYVVETGTCAGGSALLWASILENTSNGKVITIDCRNVVDVAAERHRLWKRIIPLRGDVIECFDAVKDMVDGERVMVILDSAHGKEHVLNEMSSYGTLLTPGDYMIVQDSLLNGHPISLGTGPGPYEAIEVFMEQHSDTYEIDSSMERMGSTCHPDGYIVRK